MLPRFFRTVLGCLVAAASTALARPISVSELNYNPLNSQDYEFIEIVNPGTTAYDLTGCRFTSAVTYTFGSLVLQPGQRTVICADRAKFASIYGNVANLAPGAYTGRFANSGEQVTFVTPSGAVLFSFKFSNGGDWPSRADGLGSSLECVDPNGDLSDPFNWRSSAEYLGSPGRAGVGGTKTLVVNEVLAHTDPPLTDAVELKNLTGQPVDISGWYLSNSRATPKKYRFPAGTVVPANGYFVVYEYAFNASSPKPGDTPFTYNSAHGDECVVTSADANGNLLLWIDAVSFDASQNGFSFGRWPDGTGRLVTMSKLTFGTGITASDSPDKITEFITGKGASNAYPRVGPVVFNRIMYHPTANGDEFVELQNAADGPVPLYDPLYPANTWRITSGIDYWFPTGVVLGAGEKVLVVATNPPAFRTKYGIPDAVRIYGPYTNKLSDTGDTVRLYKPDPPQLPPHPDAGFVPYILVEEVSYLPTAPWPVQADGTGAALKRINVAQYADDPAAWTVDTAPPKVAPPMAGGWTGTKVRLSWAAKAGTALVLEGRADALSGAWNTVASFPAPGADGSQSFEVVPDGDTRFFRLRVP